MNLYICPCLLALLPVALAIYHELSASYFVPPNWETRAVDTFFGYSITYDSEHANLIISSPAEGNIGEVYKCDLQDRNCSALSKSIKRLSSNYTHKYLFGATVKAGPNFVVMCAPRYVEKNPIYNLFGNSGKCFSYKNGSVSPMKSVDGKERNEETHKKFEQTMDTFGWSIDVGSNDAVLVGGPGMFNGRAMLYDVISSMPSFLKKNSHTAAFNFGYSVASGTFINKDLFYAVGSTYGDIGSGQVYFYKGKQWNNVLSKEVDTKVVGSMFGAVLCAAVLNGNRTQSLTGMSTDLLVGAPTYATESEYNIGAVYIYLALRKGRSPDFKRKIVGQSEGSMFGSAICNMGDLNGDNKDEIAIGAPFENGQGAVYIYSGMDLISDKTEKTLTWLQRIEPEPSRHYTSFGFSLARLYDSDENGCDELAIGAPYSDFVVLVRCMAAVTVKLTTRFPKLQNRLGKVNFFFQVCLLVDYPRKPAHVIASLSTTVEMIHPFAKLNTPTGTLTFVTSLEDKKKEYCSSLPFTLPQAGKYDTEIDVVATSTLLNSPIGHRDFKSSRVVLSDRSKLSLKDSVWAAECAGSECKPQLTLTTNSTISDNYKIGSSDKETVFMTVFNSGEVAYDACLRLRISGATVFQRSPACVAEPDGKLLCTPTKPIRNNSTWSTGNIVLDMESLTNQNRHIQIDMFLYSRCKEPHFTNLTTTFTLQADYSGISVVGITNIGDIVNITKDEVQTDGKQMEHMYTITNNGVTKWVGLTTIVTLPKVPYIKYNANPAALYVDDTLTPNPCVLLSNSTEKFHYIECKIDSLMQEVIKIIAPMYIIPGTLDGILDEKNITLNSSISVLLPNETTIEIKRSILTTIQLSGKVPPWVIMLGSLVGLMILVIIALILHKVGFLQRKNKEKLQELKRNVHRQSMRRSMMVRSINQRENDRLQMLTEELQEDSQQST